MGIKDFFRKVGRGIGKFAGKVWEGVKKVGSVVKKVGGIAGKIAKPILTTMSFLPGKIGKFGKIAAPAVSIAEKFIEKIPSEEARDKLQGVLDKGKGVMHKASEKAEDIAGKVAPWAKYGLDVMKDPRSIYNPPGGGRFSRFMDKVKPWAKFGEDVVKTVKPIISGNGGVAKIPNPIMNPIPAPPSLRPTTFLKL